MVEQAHCLPLSPYARSAPRIFRWWPAGLSRLHLLPAGSAVPVHAHYQQVVAPAHKRAYGKVDPTEKARPRDEIIIDKDNPVLGRRGEQQVARPQDIPAGEKGPKMPGQHPQRALARPVFPAAAAEAVKVRHITGLTVKS